MSILTISWLIIDNMNISDREKAVLAQVEMGADCPTAIVAENLGCPEYTVRRILRRLKERGIIRLRPFIDLQTLGYCEYAAFFSLASRYAEARSDLLATLGKSPRVLWLAALAGEFQVGVTFATKTPREAFSLLSEVSRDYCQVLFDKTFSTRLAIIHFGRKYLGPAGGSTPEMGYGDSQKICEIDQTDRLILSGLLNKDYNSHRELAELLDIPLSTFTYRLAKLRERRILKGFFYLVDSHKLGMNPYKLLLQTRSYQSKFHKQLLSFAQGHPQIITLLQCLGHWDYELEVDVADTEAIAVLVQELYDHFPLFLNSVKAVPILRLPLIPVNAGDWLE